jgi:hypothetical protein
MAKQEVTAARGHKLILKIDDGNWNTYQVAEDALELAKMAYKRLVQIVNGKKVRNVGSKEQPVKQEFPLESMSEERRKFYEDEFAAIHEQAFKVLETGRKNVTIVRNVPK